MSQFTTPGFDAIISQFRAKADNLAIRANACLTEAADLMELASKLTPTDEMTDPLLDSHIGGLAHRDGKAQFRECCRKDADRAADLASSLLRESHRLSSMADQLTHPAGHAPMLPTPLLGVPAAPMTEAEDAKASRLAAAAEAWAANEIDEDEPVGELLTDAQIADVMFGPAVQEPGEADAPCEKCGKPCPSIAPLGVLLQRFICHQCFRAVPKSAADTVPTLAEVNADAREMLDVSPLDQSRCATCHATLIDSHCRECRETGYGGNDNASLTKIGLKNGQTMMVPADDHAPAPVPAEEVATTAANSPAVLTPPAPLAPVMFGGDEEDILAKLTEPRTEPRLRQLLKIGKPDGMPSESFTTALAGLRKSGVIGKKSGKLHRN